jgi:hypothetical protein
MEASVTFVAGRVFGPLVLFAGVNFRVDFERDHYNPPLLIGNCNARLWH